MKKIGDIQRLPDAELDIMLYLWQRGEAAKIADIYDGLRQVRPCTRSAIHSLIERLEGRGFVSVELIGSATPYKLVTARIREDDYRTAESKNFVDKLCRGSWRNLMASLIDSDEIGEDDLTEICEMLRKKGAKP